MLAVAVSVALAVALLHQGFEGDGGVTLEGLQQQQTEQVKQRKIDVGKRLLAMRVKIDDILFYKTGDVETVFWVHKEKDGTLDAMSWTGSIETFWGDEYGEKGVIVLSDGGTEHIRLLAKMGEELNLFIDDQAKRDLGDR
ncbi:MAG: hypothetical protein AAB726_03060 [Patescibacteria group bacterium]